MSQLTFKEITLQSQEFSKIKDIYIKSFPKYERQFSIEEICNNAIKYNISVNAIMDNDNIVGLAMIYTTARWHYLMYFAIDESCRNNQYGTRALNYMLDTLQKPLYLVIEELNPDAENIELRQRRKDFYLRNRMYGTNVNYLENGNVFEILTSDSTLNMDLIMNMKTDIEKYHKTNDPA